MTDGTSPAPAQPVAQRVPRTLRPERRWAATGIRRIGVGLACLVVALVLLGQGIFLARAIGGGVWNVSDANVQLPTTGSLPHRLNAALANALGASDRGARRFVIVRAAKDVSYPRLSAVTVRWAINSDISAGTIGNGAQDDVYAILRNIFTSGLPIASVRLDGTYPQADGSGHTRETVVMRLSMSRAAAEAIGKIGWDNLDPQTAWPLVDRLYVNPQFQPLPQE